MTTANIFDEPRYFYSSHAPDFINSFGWKGLLFLNIYRICIAMFLVALSIGEVIHVRSPEVAQVFSVVVWMYLLLSGLHIGGVMLHKIPYLLQVSVGMLLDVMVFAAFNFTVFSGAYFNILLLVALSGASVLAHGGIAWIYASMAVLALLFQALQLFLLGIREEEHFIPIAMYCVTCYVVVAGIRWLAKHIERTENMAESIAAHMGHINEHIIDILRAGVLAVDDGGKVLFANRPAIHLLECKHEPVGKLLPEVAPELAAWVDSTKGRASRKSFQFNGIDAQVVSLPKRYGIGAQKLITMEQSSMVREQAEAIKNASLARMAASITHEIRNPLGAISHAAQLLQEDQAISGESREMTSVVVRHVSRIDTIVANITQMGRVVPSYEVFALLPWLREFASEMRKLWSLGEDAFVVAGLDGLMVEADKSQIHQALTNLCDNARRYSSTMPLVALSVGVDGDLYAYVDVIDNGKVEIEPKQMQHLFEPFSSSSGSLGLGLYISRELVKANGGSLLLLQSNGNGSVFRLRVKRSYA